MGKTTPRQFRMFKSEVQRLVKKYGVNDFRVEFHHDRLKDCRAQVLFEGVSHVIDVSLSTHWGDDEPTDAKIRSAAHHEFAHMLIVPVHALANARFVTSDEVQEATERTVRRLQHILFGSCSG